MANPRLVAYAYGDPTWTSSATDAGSTVATLWVTELVGGVQTQYQAQSRAVLPFYAPEEANDQLRDLQAKLNASGAAGTYELFYDATAQAVTIRTTNGVEFYPYGPNAWTAWSGCSWGAYAFLPWATSHTGTARPGGIVKLYGATVNAIVDAPRVQMSDYRLGRSVATAWGNHATHSVQLYIRSADKACFDTGYCLSGRVRIVQGTDNTDPYSADNPGGYVDGYVVAVQNLQEDGDLGELWTCDMLLAVARG